MYGLNELKNFSENGYIMEHEPLLAALFTTGNGYMGVRGSFEEFGSLRIQGAFVRGFIDEIVEVMEPFCDNEYIKKYYINEEKLKGFERQESCVNMPDFTLIRIEIGGRTFFPWEGKLLEWKRGLDASAAIYSRKVLWDDGSGNRTSIMFERFASFHDDHLYCQRVTVTPINHKLPVRIISGVDAAVKTGGQIITCTDKSQSRGSGLLYKFSAVNKYNFSAAYAIGHNFPNGAVSESFSEGTYALTCDAAPAETYILEKFTYVLTSRDTREDIEAAAQGQLGIKRSYEDCVAAHIRNYKDYFYVMDVEIDGDAEADGYLRFASYHTAISACRNDSVHGAAAKGLTGERYNQFVWWDCEIYQLPFFIYTAPETAKQQLLYRSRMLAQSMKNASAEGRRGARYAFCSSVTGEERVWQYTRHPFMQVHINSDISYCFIRYYDVTRDTAFLKEHGMPVIYQCLLYWTDRVTERNGRYEILQVTGTDEHHPYVDNNAYTNYSVQYTARRFIELCCETGYSIPAADKEKIADMAERLYLPAGEDGLIPQFDGYFGLKRGLEEQGNGTHKSFQMKRGGLYHKSQIIKQPDLILLYTYLNVGMDRKSYAANWDYYEQMCESSSSLSFPPHAIASADNGRPLSFYQYFMKVLKIDAADIHGVGWQGVHSGCLAGGYLSVLRGIFGVEADSGGNLNIRPVSMPLWKKITLRFYYREALYEISMCGEDVTLRLEKGKAQTILINGQPVKAGGVYNFMCNSEGRR